MFKEILLVSIYVLFLYLAVINMIYDPNMR